MKKVLSLILALAMATSCGTVAFAAPADVTNEKQVEAVDALMSVGVVNGYEDGSYKPEQTVTRAEMAKLLVEALDYGDLVAGSTTSFPDAKGLWYEGHVAIAEGLGILNGYPDGTVKGDYPVSYQEAITMIVRALGYNDMGVNKAVDKYNATAYKTKATSIGILDDVTVKTGGANRGDIAVMLYNALDAQLVDVDADGKVTGQTDPNDNNNAKLLIDRLATKDKKDITPSYIDSEDHLVDLNSYVGENCTVYLNDDDEVIFVKESNSDVKTGEADATAKDIKVDGKKFDASKITDKTKVYINYLDAKTTTVSSLKADLASLDEEDVKIVYDEDDSDKISAICYKKANESLIADKDYQEGRKYIECDGSKLYLPADDDDKVVADKLIIEGDVKTLAEIKENDVIEVYAEEDLNCTSSSKVDEDTRMTLVVTRKTVEGKVRVESTNSSDKVKDVTINGVKYKFVDDAMEKKSFVGDEYKLYLNEEGKVVKAEKVKSNTVSDYAVIKEVKDGYKADGVSIKDPKLVVVTSKGESVTYVLDTDADDVKAILDSNGTNKYAITGLKAGQVILFDTNSDNEIDEITVANEKDTDLEDLDESTQEIDTTKKSFAVSDDVVIFYYDKDDLKTADKKIDGDVKVVKADELGDNVVATASIKNDDGEYELLVLNDKGSSDTLYAVIDSVKKATNDDDDTVQQVVAYINGEEVTKYTDGKNVAPFDFDGETVYAIKMSGDAITEVTTAQAISGGKLEGTITSVSGNRFKFKDSEGNETWEDLADTYGIYVFDEDGGFDYIGETGDLDLDGYTATIYDFDNSDDADGYEVVILKAVK